MLRVIGRNRHVVDSFRSCQYGRGESWLSFEEASWGGDTRVDAESDEVKNVGENSNVVKNRRLGTSDRVRAASRHTQARTIHDCHKNQDGHHVETNFVCVTSYSPWLRTLIR